MQPYSATAPTFRTRSTLHRWRCVHLAAGRKWLPSAVGTVQRKGERKNQACVCLCWLSMHCFKGQNSLHKGLPCTGCCRVACSEEWGLGFGVGAGRRGALSVRRAA